MAERTSSVTFLGLKVDPLTMSETLQRCEELISMRNKQHVVINAAKVVAASESVELRQIINSCDLVNADGMSVVWAAKLLGKDLPERVAGIDLMFELVQLSKQKGFSIFLLGAEETVSETVFSSFQASGANVIGRRNGFWSQGDEAELVDEIASKAPDILFIAIPSPQKEIFLSQHLGRLNCGLVVGVGGSFDVVAGKVVRAPKVLQRMGLEWTIRLIQEPRRMFLRYLKGNSKFIWLVIKAIRTSKPSKELNDR